MLKPKPNLTSKVKERLILVVLTNLTRRWSPGLGKKEPNTSSLTDKPVFDKGLVLPDKLIHLSKSRASNARESPRATLIPSPRGTDNVNKCSAVAGGGGGAPLELIDA